MTQDTRKGLEMNSPDDKHITRVLSEGSQARQRSEAELRSILGSPSDIVEVRIVSELQLVSQIIGQS